jgi:SEC-C motif-containing protein
MADNGARLQCPCGSGEIYDGCCGPLHSGEARAATAEQLMRSRYSAFAMGDAAYLRRSWHSSTRPKRLELDKDTRWIRLEILETRDGGPFHTSGTVRFRAQYAERGAAPVFMEENSSFSREHGAWVYVSAL